MAAAMIWLAFPYSARHLCPELTFYLQGAVPHFAYRIVRATGSVESARVRACPCLRKARVCERASARALHTV